MKDFLSNYGYLIGYGLEIYGWGKGDTSNLVKNTLRRREEGLKDDMLVINDIGELVYCVDNSNGKVISWDVSNGDYAEEALDLETKSITQNGTYTPSVGKDGFDSVTVNVSGEEEPDLVYTYKNKTVITAEDLVGFTEIPNNMFSGDTNLMYIEIPEGVISIGSSAFSNCTNLIEVKLPSTLTRIDTDAFYNCTSLYKINVPIGCQVGSAFLNTALRNIVVTSNPSKAVAKGDIVETVTIAEGITEIGACLDQATHVYELNLPSTLSKFTGNNRKLVFRNACLQNITFPDNITVIPNSLLSYCWGLRSISLPDGITSFGTSAITDNNKKLKTIYVRGNSSCTTATTLGNLTAAQLNNATVVYLENE